VNDRGPAVRAFWIRMVPRVPSRKPRTVGRWRDLCIARPAAIEARLVDPARNSVEVRTDHLAAFEILIDPETFNMERSQIHVRINDGVVPVTQLILPQIADLLEDYRERRDPGLLIVDRITIGVR
jgi:hypothetical protein